MLEESDIFAGLNLPLTLGAARLEALEMQAVALVAPFKGQSMAVADALLAEIGMILPQAGRCGQSDHAKAYWRGPGQWLVFGQTELVTKTGKVLAGMASVVDMSGAYSRVLMSGDTASTVLARLIAVDLELLATGDVTHTALADIPVTLITVETGLEIMTPRSLTGSAMARLEVAMQSVAAQALRG